MVLLEFGGAHGLAYRENYQEDIQNALALKQLQRQANIDAENRVKLLGTTQYADTSKMNDWDAKQVTDYSHKVSDQIGSLIADHPDITRDPVAYNELTRLRGQMLDNEYVRHGMQMTSMIDQFNKYRATTPGTDDLPEMQKMTADLKRYTDTGTIDPTGKEKIPFQFADPLETYDFGADVTARSKTLGKISEWDPSANNGIGGFVETNVPDSEIEKEAYNIAHVYHDSPKARILFSKLSPQEQSYYGVNNASDATRSATMDRGLLNWVKGALKARTDQKIQPIRVGQPRAGVKGSETSLTGYSPFVNNVQNFAPNVITNDVNAGALATVYKVGDKTLLNPSEPFRVLIDDGKSKKWTMLNSYNGIPTEVQSVADGMNRMTDSGGRVMLEYNARVPLKPELTKGDTPLLKDNKWFGDPAEYSTGDTFQDYKEMPSTQNTIRIERDDKGKPTGFANVRVWYPAGTDPSHTQKYDDNFLGKKGANEAVTTRMQAQQKDTFENFKATAPEGQEVTYPNGNVWVKTNGEWILKK